MLTNSIKDIATDVINYAMYHRAQIAQHVNRASGTPAVTDYIVYQREFQKQNKLKNTTSSGLYFLVDAAFIYMILRKVFLDVFL